MSEEVVVDSKTLDLLIRQYYNIANKIQTQYSLIVCQFNVKPKYVLLGVEADKAIKRYVLSQHSNPAHTFSRSANDPTESILKAYFDLTPIVDTSLPLKLAEDFIQVVVPPEAYS